MTDQDQNTILVVDDSPTILHFVKDTLEKYNFAVLTATNGHQGLAIAENKKPDLILLDVMMPDMDGFEICARLKDDTRTRHIPVVFITASDRMEDEVSGLDLGAEDFIHKPIHEAVLLARVRQILRRLQAEEQLRASKESHRILLDNIQTQVWHLTDEHTYGAVNRAHADFLGHSPQEIAKRDMYEFLPREVVEVCRKGNRDVFSKGQQYHTEEWIPSASGEQRLLSITKTPKMDDRGIIEFVVCSAEDITERRRAEEEIKNKTALLEAILDNTPDIMSVKRPDLSVVRYNKAGYAFLNKSQEQIEGSKCYELIGRTAPCIPCATQEAVKAGKPVALEKYLPELDMHLNCRANPILSDDGRVEYTVELIRDITARKKAEEEIRKFKTVSDQAVHGIAISNMQGDILYINDFFARIHGFKPDELIGRNLVVFHNEQQLEDVRKINKALVDDGHYINQEVWHTHKDGNAFPMLMSGVVIKDDHGAAKFLAATAIDITQRKRAEEALASAKEQAEAANQAKSEFLANMSHEIRTPINGIMGMMQLLETTPLDADQEQYVALCKTSANRLTRLLSDILDLSRVEAGKMSIHEAEFIVQELGDSVSDLFKVTAGDKGVHLECAIDPDIPMHLIGDEARVRQVLFNLVGNALKFTKEGSVRLEMTSLGMGEADVFNVLFTISDTGVGIPDDKIDGLFDPFVQVDGSYTRSFQGAGLGLAIVKRLVDLMGGKISMKSAVGEGTTVQVLLPFKPTKGTSIPAEQGSMQSPRAGRSLRILLAEDEPSNALPIRMLLEKAGHAVTLVENGHDAVELFQTQSFDCILMDIQMPVMNGVEATKMIRSQESGVRSQGPDAGETTSSLQVSGFSPQPSRRIPIIALTAYAMLGDREKFLEAGMDDYLAKPVKMDDLARVLEKNIRS